MNTIAHTIIDDCLAGITSERLSQLALAAIGVFGAFRSGEYHGFDYTHQAHIHRFTNITVKINR